MEEQQVTVKTVLLGGISGTVTIDTTGETASFLNPGQLPLIANVTKAIADIQRLSAGNPPKEAVVAILKR